MSRPATMPWITLVLAGIAMALFASGSFDATLATWAYQREAIFAGEFWRLFTAHLVHYSPRHLIMNLLAFSALAIVAECRLGHKTFALLWCVPAMTTYAGISGINYGLLMCLALRQLQQVIPATLWAGIAGLTTLAMVMVILLWQQGATDHSPFIGELAGVRVAWQAHLAGVLAAALLAMISQHREAIRRSTAAGLRSTHFAE